MRPEKEEALREKFIEEVHTDGLKHDSGKTRWDLLPFDIIEELAEIMTVGSIKYGDNNWQNVNKERYVAAELRHFAKWRSGEVIDAESEKPHLAHAMVNLMFIRWIEKHEGEKNEN